MYSPRQRTLLAFILAAHTASAWADEQSFTIDERNTVPSFEVDHLGFSTQRGHFNQTSGKVVMDEQKRTGKVDIHIDANSIDTGITYRRGEVLRDPEVSDGYGTHVRFCGRAHEQEIL